MGSLYSFEFEGELRVYGVNKPRENTSSNKLVSLLKTFPACLRQRLTLYQALLLLVWTRLGLFSSVEFISHLVF